MLLRARTLTGVVVAGLLLGGCTAGSDDGDGGASRVVQLGPPGESPRVLGPDEEAAVDVLAHTAEDVAFVQGMIPHHAQALEMTALVAGRASGADIPAWWGGSRSPSATRSRRWSAGSRGAARRCPRRREPCRGPGHGGG